MDIVPRQSYKKLRYLIKQSGSAWVSYIRPTIFGISFSGSIVLGIDDSNYTKDHIVINLFKRNTFCQKDRSVRTLYHLSSLKIQMTRIRHLMYHMDKNLAQRYTEEEIEERAKKAVEKVGWAEPVSRGNRLPMDALFNKEVIK